MGIYVYRLGNECPNNTQTEKQRYETLFYIHICKDIEFFNLNIPFVSNKFCFVILNETQWSEESL